MLYLSTQPVRVLSTGQWSTGQEVPEKQARWGDANGGHLVEYVEIHEPDGGGSRKITLAPNVRRADFPDELSVVELDLLAKRGTKKFRGETFEVDKFQCTAFRVIALAPKVDAVKPAAVKAA